MLYVPSLFVAGDAAATLRNIAASQGLFRLGIWPASPARRPSSAERQALAMLFLDLHGQGILFAKVFFGLWLVPLGLLVARSGFLPKVLGALLVVGGAGYIVDVLVHFLATAPGRQGHADRDGTVRHRRGVADPLAADQGGSRGPGIGGRARL